MQNLILASITLLGAFGAKTCKPKKPMEPREPIRGVNLGGWLLLEPWITPSLFNDLKDGSDLVVDEYTFTKTLGKEKAKAKLAEHWDSFVTDKDFKVLKKAGINYVRIPVRYWAYNRTDDEPWVDGSAQHLVRGIQLAKEYGMKAMIDAHGAPLSQNGFDNSGQAGGINFLTDDMSGKRMLDVLEKITIQFSTSEFKKTVTAIQLVNEPAGWEVNKDKLKTFYDDGYNIIRKHNQDVEVTFHDAFLGTEYWEYLSSKKNILLDTHIYNIFNDDAKNWTPAQHLNNSCHYSQGLEKSKSKIPTFVGEWSLATTDCTLYLNGFLKGSRYVGNFKDHNSPRLDKNYDFKSDKCAPYDSLEKFPPGHTDLLKQFFDRQIGVWENAGSGWFFWNFKAENSPEWNFIMGYEKGWIRIPAVSKNTCFE